MIKVVLDTNIWISAFITPFGIPGRIVHGARVRSSVSVYSTSRLLQELVETLEKTGVRKTLMSRGTWGAARRFAANHTGILIVPTVVPLQNWLPSDPDDDWVIQCALTAGADCIVTGDRALLALGTAEGIRLLDPKTFLKEMG